jgi:amino acid adenylation domain-containing protein
MSGGGRLEGLTASEKRALLGRMLQERAQGLRSRRAPASYPQARMWLLQQLDPQAATYNLHYALRLKGSLDVKALEWAVGEIVLRHESLRTTFHGGEAGPEQVVQPEMRVPLSVVDLGDVPEGERLARAASLGIEERRRPFDLAEGPLLRAMLQRLGDADHVLLLVVHHIVADGWSIGLLLGELGRLYSARVAAGPNPLKPLPQQYADFAAWQRANLQGEALQSQLDYWKQKLAGLAPALDLPIDGDRRAGSSREAETSTVVIAPRRLQELKDLSRSAGATPFMAVLAALQLLLRRLTGEDDVVVGSPIAGRTLAGTEELIGFFVNMLVLRTDLSGDPTFLEVLERVRGVTHGAFANQDLPFERLLEELSPERALNRTPLFQVYLNMLSFQDVKPSLEGLEVEALPPYEVEANFDLTFYVKEERDGLHLSCVYRSALFAGARIEELLRQLDAVLASVVEDPRRRVAAIDLVTPQAKAALPDGRAPLARGHVGTLEALVSRPGASGRRVLLSGPEGEWTWDEFQQRVDDLAQDLLYAGLEPGEVVGIHARRSAHTIAAMLGVLRAGGAFAILDPAYPGRRLAESWRVASPRGLVVVEGSGELSPALQAALESDAPRFRLVLGGDARGARKRGEKRLPFPERRSEDPAYVAFTSGTTGGVKAILGAHGPVVHFLDWQMRTFGLGKDDRFAMLAGLSHDPLLRDVFAPLFVEGTLFVPAAGSMAEPGWLAEWMRSRRVTVAHLTPAMAQLLCGAKPGVRLDDLRYAFFGGDVLDARAVRELRRVAPNVTCVNFYGATETPQAMGYAVVSANAEESGERIPLGKGIEGVQLLVLNARDALCGIGELGEIVVRTPHLSRGYLGDEEMTRRRFPPNPITGAADDRVYRTGDLGRYLPDGSVQFVGRQDAQVKLRGFRIELGEVEAAMREHPGVAEAVAILGKAPSGEDRLVGYFVPARGAALAQGAELRAFLRERLPEYAVPSALLEILAVPLTPNGKVDRRALPEPDAVNAAEAYEPARTPDEEMLVGLFQEVLGVARVGRHDGFFDLGGHSLLATQAVARLRSWMGVEVPLRALFEAPTPAALASRIEALRQASAGLLPPPLSPAGREGELALSFAQQRMWVLDQIEGGTAAYSLAGALDLRGTLDEGALRRALDTVVARHEVLRTVFRQVDGRPAPVVLADGSPGFAVVELSGEDASEAALVRRLRDRAMAPFDLARGPLVRVTLFRLGPERHVLLLCSHHVVSDGWSMGVFVRELTTFYEQLVSGREPELPPLPVQYSDFAAWQRAWLQGDVIDRQLAFWRAKLQGAPGVLDLPTDKPRPPVPSHRGERISFTLPPSLQQRLAEISRREGATMFMTLLTAFQVMLFRYSGQADVVVGMPVANRSRPEIEGLIGFFANTLLLRTDLTGNPRWRDLLGQVRANTLDALAHQDLPFERLVEDLRPERDASRNPLFQVMFALQNVPRPRLDLKGLAVTPLEVDRQTAQVDLTLYVHETEEGLKGVFEYATDLWDAATITRMCGHLERLLSGLVDSPEARLSELPLLSASEVLRLADWNETTRPFPAASVHDLVLEQARRTPERIAAEAGGERLTYGALAERSALLAEHLSGLGVGPDARVGIYMERSLGMLVALLGVLRAGGAYVPLDPSYPRERLAHMVEDSGLQVVLTESALKDRMPREGPTAVCIDEEWPGPRKPPQAADPSHLAYVIYTSGSTGKPKGVAVTHRSLVNLLASMGATPGLGAHDVLLSVTTLSFDIAGLEIYLPLLAGAKLVLAGREESSDGHRLEELIESTGATVMQATPATWRLLLEAGWAGSKGLRVLCGGEAMPRELASELVGRAAEVWNVYGPTETTIWSSAWRVEAGPGPILIGSPIANTTLHVLDRDLNPLPVGVGGELYIGGDGLARGYWGRPDLTAERFVPDPFSRQLGARMYQTGDLARRLPDGSIECLGRLDHQVKVRGFRIELGEIESSLRRHPGVEGAVVLAQDLLGGDRRLVAYLAHGSSGQPNVTALRNHLKASLPTYMIPSSFVFLDRFPLTPNGKVDRKALARFESGLTSGARSHVAPRTPVEAFIAETWREALGIDRVGIRDNFFDLGGHSLLAMRVLSAIEKRTGHRFHPRDIIFQTLEQLAAGCPAELPAPVEAAAPGGLARRVLGAFQALVKGGGAATPES